MYINIIIITTHADTCNSSHENPRRSSTKNQTTTIHVEEKKKKRQKERKKEERGRGMKMFETENPLSWVGN